MGPCRGAPGVRSDGSELAKLLALAAGCSRVVVFSGSGLSAPSGAAADLSRLRESACWASLKQMATGAPPVSVHDCERML
jgi:hypothetical protein